MATLLDNVRLRLIARTERRRICTKDVSSVLLGSLKESVRKPFRSGYSGEWLVVKSLGLVWKRNDLTRAEFRDRWLGEHAQLAGRLNGLRGYVIDFAEEAPEGAPDAVATVYFDNREALDAAFRSCGTCDWYSWYLPMHTSSRTS